VASAGDDVNLAGTVRRVKYHIGKWYSLLVVTVGKGDRFFALNVLFNAAAVGGRAGDIFCFRFNP